MMTRAEIEKEVNAILKMTIRRADAVGDQLRDCERSGQKERARVYRVWLRYLHRVQALLNTLKQGKRKEVDKSD